MTLRLVLVGVVASLGLTLPSRDALQAWTHSGHTWMNAKFADWDADRPVEEEAVVFVADAIRPVRPVQVVDVPRPVVPAVSRPTDDGAFRALVEEWVAGVSMVAVQPAAPKTDRVVRTVSPNWFETEFNQGAPAWESREAKAVLCVAEIPQAPATPPEATKAADPGALDRAFNAVMDETIVRFSQDLAAHEKPVKVEARGAASRVASRDAPRFEPVEVSDDLYPGEAFALNREAEGLGPLSPLQAAGPKASIPVVSASLPQANRLANAVRLTREAVNAWANLLHGPAVVAISR